MSRATVSPTASWYVIDLSDDLAATDGLAGTFGAAIVARTNAHVRNVANRSTASLSDRIVRGVNRPNGSSHSPAGSTACRVEPGSHVDTQRQKHLVLILAREFASNLSTPTLIADAHGDLVFYNEAAEAVVGRRFAETGEMRLDDWSAAFEPRTVGSEPLPPERRPPWIALKERRAAHLRYLVTSADGVERAIDVTALPLFAHTDEFVGIVVIIWRV